MVKITYEVENQPKKNLWDEARNSEDSSIHSKEGKTFTEYLNILLNTAFKAGIEFQKNLKEEITY